MENTKMNLHQKLVQIRKEVKYVQKEGKGYNFSYATGADLICAIRPKMDELNVILQPSMESFEFIEIRKGTGIITVPKIVVSHTWIDADNPSDRFTTKATYFEDKMTGCQSVGSMMTYAERYFLYKFFQIATGADDIETIYKDNEWEAKADKQKEEKPINNAKIEDKRRVELKDIEETISRCRILIGDKIENSELFRFLTALATAYNHSLEKFESKIAHWKNDSSCLLKDFDSFVKKYPKPVV